MSLQHNWLRDTFAGLMRDVQTDPVLLPVDGLEFPKETVLADTACGSWLAVVSASDQRTQGAWGQPSPLPPTARGYSLMTEYNTTAES